MLILCYFDPYHKNRVLPDLSVSNLRKEIHIQLEGESIPNSFAFVRGVGRHFTEVSQFTFLSFLDSSSN